MSGNPETKTRYSRFQDPLNPAALAFLSVIPEGNLRRHLPLLFAKPNQSRPLPFNTPVTI